MSAPVAAVKKPHLVHQPDKIPAAWLKELRRLPGYDPVKGAKKAGLVFDATSAQFAIDWIQKHHRHVKGPLGGQPYILADHERCIVANLFGWKRKDGTRRYRKVLVLIGRGNSKTTFAAAVASLILNEDPEPGKELYCVASDATQSKILFDLVKQQVRDDEYLGRKCETFQRTIVRRDEPSRLEMLSSTADTKHGQNPNAVFRDELHVINRETADVLESGLVKRPQSLLFDLTTSDFDQPSKCNEVVDYAKGVIDGTVDDLFFLPAIWEISSEDADWLCSLKPGEGKKADLLRVFRKANPGLGHSIIETNLLEAWNKAQQMPSYLSTFLRLHCNVRTQQENRWLDLAQWDACGPGLGEPTDPVEWRQWMEEQLQGAPCNAGLDLASTGDFIAFVLTFVHRGRKVVLPYFWVPERGTWTKSPYLALYETWIRQGFVRTTPGDLAEYSEVRADISGGGTDSSDPRSRDSLIDRFAIGSSGADATFQGIELFDKLANSDKLPLVGIRQNWQGMSAGSFELERLIASGELNHGNNPVLRWMAGSVGIQEDATGKFKRPVRPDNRWLKIDGIVALVMAISRLITTPEGSGRSIYSDPPPDPNAQGPTPPPARRGPRSPYDLPPPDRADDLEGGL